jgi:uncharacterized protein YicC (UPF0701 family)
VETRTGSLDKEIKANQKQLTQRCESLEKTVASEAASQKARSEAVATDSAAARGRIEERLTTSTNEHHQKLLDISTALAQAASEAKAQIVKEEKQLEAAAAKLDKRADLLSGVVEANLSNSLAAVASLDPSCHQTQATVTSKSVNSRARSNTPRRTLPRIASVWQMHLHRTCTM